ncbi:MAG: YtxH domain-containing protein [Acidobacteria bacterium]|nr:YtxH domain-containing protein [Acidobacteriota bacterium]
MADHDRYETEGNGAGFMMGLLAGTVLGAGLGMLLAPKAGADLRGQIGQQAREFGNRASEQYRRATQAASGLAERGRDMMNQAREAVSRGAEEARGYTGTTTGSTYTGGTQGTPGGTDYGRS